jgi:two-component system response regulator FlrC
MLEATLFGHERGAFTGAIAAGQGLFRAAQGGTLFLDEVAELPLALQAKLLRAVQEREVMPVGATVAQPIDVRIIAAANRDLAAEVGAGRFRADLFYRLAVFPLRTLPLAARPADITAITAHRLLQAGQGRLPWPTARALAAHDWPGNVRELGWVQWIVATLRSDDWMELNDEAATADIFLGFPACRDLGSMATR